MHGIRVEHDWIPCVIDHPAFMGLESRSSVAKLFGIGSQDPAFTLKLGNVVKLRVGQ